MIARPVFRNACIGQVSFQGKSRKFQKWRDNIAKASEIASTTIIRGKTSDILSGREADMVGFGAYSFRDCSI
jgi:hypothetical protein